MFLLQDALERAAADHPDRTAVVCGNDRATWRELRARSRRFAGGLQRAGVRRGAVVAVWMPKSVDAVAAWFGSLIAGAAYAPVDSGSPASRVERILERSRPAAVVVPEAFQPPTGAWARDIRWVRPSELSGAGAEPEPVGGTDLDWAWIHFTSGSTGAPKGAVLTHRAALSYLASARALLGRQGPGERVANHAPFSFDLASFDVHVATSLGAELHLLPESAAIAPGSVLEFLRGAAPTLLYTVPTTLHRLAALRSIEQARFESLTALIFAGEPPNVSALRTLRPVFPNATFHHWYGSTEAPLVAAIAFAPAEPLPDTLPLGTVVPNVEVALLDSSGALVPPAPGREDELVVSGTALLDGYCHDRDETAKAFLEPIPAVDGGRRWYRLRDRVVVQPDGRLAFAGRADRMVKVAGMRVDPSELEAAALRAAGVRECAVIARPAPEGGARLVACYVGDADPAALTTHFRASLPRYMVPERCLKIDAIPTTATGKVDRDRLAALVAAASSASDRPA